MGEEVSGTTRVRVQKGYTGISSVWDVPSGFGSHYARCAKDPATISVLRSMLGLVGYDASSDFVGRLSFRDRVELEVYASREHAAASDNRVQRHPRPTILPPPWRGNALRSDAPTVLRAPNEVD